MASDSKEQSVESTNRTAQVRFTNRWGVDLRSATVRHRFKNDPAEQQEKTWYDIPSGSSTADDDYLTVYYKTGSGAHTDYDYWWVSIQDNAGNIYKCKNNFYCYLTADDAGGVVKVIVDGGSEDVKIEPPKSSAASASMTKS